MTTINNLALYGHQPISDIERFQEWRIPKLIEDLQNMYKNTGRK